MGSDDRELREVRAARNQSLFREVNERVESLVHEFDPGERINFICECANSDCKRHIEMTMQEYETVRLNSTHFAISSGHDAGAVDAVVARYDRFWIVEKLGEGADIAIATDPRHRHAGD